MTLLTPSPSRMAQTHSRSPSDGAAVDQPTGLGSHVRLLADLDAVRSSATIDGTWMLAAFELSGLHGYESTHGSLASGKLLRNLARRLVDAIDGAGTAYSLSSGRFAVLARIGRGGSQVLVAACRAALSDDGANVLARPLTTITPIDLIDPADALLLLMGAKAAAAEKAVARHEAPTVSEARQPTDAGERARPHRLPYMRISTRFRISAACGLLWMGLSAWLAKPWIVQLGHIVSLPAAIALIAGLALIPGYLNVQLVSSLLMDHPTRIDPDRAFVFPSLTLLTAAYEEQGPIAQTLAYALEQDYPGDLSVIVINDGSHDETASIARGFARIDERVRVLNVPHGGKAAALNAGLRATRTPLVATIDADTLLMPGALRRIVARMLISPADTVAVAGSVMVRNSRAGIISAAQTWDYFLGIGSIKRQQALLQATLVAQGAFSVYDATALRDAGGWPDCIGEDIVMTWALLDAGGRTTYEPTAIAFTQVPMTLRHLARQRRRWARGMIEGLRAYGFALVRRRKTYAHSIIADTMFPYLDLVFTVAFIPGIVLAMTGNFMIVGPMTLAVLPLNALLASAMYRRQRRSMTEAGLHVRRASLGFAVFFLAYQMFMSPVSVSGYVQELFHVGRRW